MTQNNNSENQLALPYKLNVNYPMELSKQNIIDLLGN